MLKYLNIKVNFAIILAKQNHREESDYINTSKLWTKPFLLLLSASFLNALAFNMVYTNIVDYSIKRLDTSMALAGTISGIFSISALFIRPVAGILTDRSNKKNLCVIATLVIATVCLGYTFCPNTGFMLAFRILHGAAFGVSSTVNVALASCYLPKTRLAEGIGYYGLGQVFAQAVGPGIGEAVQGLFGYNMMFIFISVLTFLAVGILLLVRYDYIPNERSPSDNSLSSILHSIFAIEVLMYAIVNGIFSFGNGIINAFLKTMCQEREIHGFAWFFTVSAIVLFVVRISIGKISDRKGIRSIVNISLIITALSLCVLANSNILATLLFAGALKAAGQGAGQVSLQAECIKRVSANRVGVANSTFFIGADIGQGVSPIIGGVLVSSLGYSSTFYMTAALFIIAFIAFNIYQKRLIKAG